jgi:two-component system sensor histidine kinase KdpD
MPAVPLQSAEPLAAVEQNHASKLQRRMALTLNSNSPWQAYGFAILVFAATSLLNFWLQDWIGYQAVALVYLLAIVLVACCVGRGPIVLGTTLTSLGWNFLFAPPRYSFHIAGTYDKMMVATLFVVALTMGELTARLRNTVKDLQRLREAELNSRLVAESERLGRTLLNSVSHELRTPIAAILSATSSLRSSGPWTSEQETLSLELEAAAARLNRVVQSLLSAARLQSGQIKPKLDWCDIFELVRSSLCETGNVLNGHPVEMCVAPRLPLIKADFVLMEQALSNLLVNAAVHTPMGSPIDIKARAEEGELVIEVGDRGPGLVADQLERIFETFHRAPGTKPGGTGLGLAIVKGFVEAQGGQVKAENRTGGGAIFRICLPIGEVPDLEEETA